VIRYRVLRGDCASSIARRFGFRDFRTIWDDPENAELRALRPDPNVLFQGDVVAIPDHEERVEEASTGRRHVFVAKGRGTFLRLRIESPRALTYELIVDDGDPVRGAVEGREPIVEPISPSARSARLTVWPTSLGAERPESAMTIPITLGALDPIAQIAGVQGRLRNLGFYVGDLDDRLSDDTREAIRAFERFLGRPETGDLTDDLRAELVAHHDVV
jgi:N-acetylmuramoyl-L-alanine amidase